MVTTQDAHVIPPTPLRFDPVFVTQDDIDDLSSFFGRSADECLARLRAFSAQELADQWLAADPKTPEEISEFYEGTDLYIWDLMQWHVSVARQPYWQILADLVQQCPPEYGYVRVLDFGCGIGTDSLHLARRGYSVTLMDLAGPAFQFAQHRFARRNIPASFLSAEELPALNSDDFDVVVCFDVFEHLPDPLGTAKQLVRILRPGGLLVQTASFFDHGNHPCHLHTNITKFSGLRWHIHLAGLGLLEGVNAYRKATGYWRSIQRTRYALWWLTGLWLTWVR